MHRFTFIHFPCKIYILTQFFKFPRSLKRSQHTSYRNAQLGLFQPRFTLHAFKRQVPLCSSLATPMVSDLTPFYGAQHAHNSLTYQSQ
jgi:hypothetical protein